MKIEFVSATDVGKLRDHNEDAVGDPQLCAAGISMDGLETHGYLFAVADGMGGHAAGEVASAMAMEALFRRYYSASGEASDALRAAFDAANQSVLSKSRMSGSEQFQMGTTLVAAVIADGHALVGNVGDSRAYLLRGDELKQVTADHSLVAEYVRQHILTEEQAASARFRNVLMQAVGLTPEVRADIFEIAMVDDDVLLLCSDGLHGVVSDGAIRDTLLTNRDLQTAAASLIARANDRGGPDNISVVLARVKS